MFLITYIQFFVFLLFRLRKKKEYNTGNMRQQGFRLKSREVHTHTDIY